MPVRFFLHGVVCRPSCSRRIWVRLLFSCARGQRSGKNDTTVGGYSGSRGYLWKSTVPLTEYPQAKAGVGKTTAADRADKIAGVIDQASKQLKENDLGTLADDIRTSGT